MVVLITQNVPASLRGELSRWMIEPRTGVFVGQVSAMVRDRLWEMAVKGASSSKRGKQGDRSGGVILLWSSPTEQGFQWRIHGDTTRDLLDFEGLSLVYIPISGRNSRKGPDSTWVSPPSPEHILEDDLPNSER